MAVKGAVLLSFLLAASCVLDTSAIRSSIEPEDESKVSERHLISDERSSFLQEHDRNDARIIPPHVAHHVTAHLVENFVDRAHDFVIDAMIDSSPANIDDMDTQGWKLSIHGISFLETTLWRLWHAAVAGGWEETQKVPVKIRVPNSQALGDHVFSLPDDLLFWAQQSRAAGERLVYALKNKLPKTDHRGVHLNANLQRCANFGFELIKTFQSLIPTDLGKTATQLLVDQVHDNQYQVDEIGKLFAKAKVAASPGACNETAWAMGKWRLVCMTEEACARITTDVGNPVTSGEYTVIADEVQSWFGGMFGTSKALRLNEHAPFPKRSAWTTAAAPTWFLECTQDDRGVASKMLLDSKGGGSSKHSFKWVGEQFVYVAEFSDITDEEQATDADENLNCVADSSSCRFKHLMNAYLEKVP